MKLFTKIFNAKSVLPIMLASSMFVGSQANAALITGDVNIGGLGIWTAFSTPTAGGDIGSYSFINPTIAVGAGDFANAYGNPGDEAQFAITHFTPLLIGVNGSDLSQLPILPLWESNDGQFRFELMTGKRNDPPAAVGGATTISLYGQGIMSSTIAGLDDTVYDWTFSFDLTNNRFAFYSAANTPAPASAPSVAALLVVGFAGLTVARRRARS